MLFTFLLENHLKGERRTEKPLKTRRVVHLFAKKLPKGITGDRGIPVFLGFGIPFRKKIAKRYHW